MGRGSPDRSQVGSPDRSQVGSQDREAAEQLSFAEASEEPVGYRLTARARRIVAPASMPDLAVVPAPAGDEAGELD
ncbi:MAG: hypothetical protein ACRDUY_14820, partial [Nitriliruptorales bacterium]